MPPESAPASPIPLSDYIECSAAAKLVPGQPAAATIWRWCTRGIKNPNGGRLYLQSNRWGGKVWTTAKWVAEFGAELSKIHQRPEPVRPETLPKPPTSATRARQIADARRKLACL